MAFKRFFCTVSVCLCGEKKPFATTHNWECIIALQIALREQQQASQEEQQQEDKQEQVQLIRLERKNRGIVPTIFHEHQLPIITRENIEVR